MHPLDHALFSACPTVCAPRFGTFEPMPTEGHRYINAELGVYKEIRRSWGHVIQQVAACSFPYGPITESLGISIDPHGIANMLTAFAAQARQAGAHETAAWGCVDPQANNALTLNPVVVIKAGIGHIRYERPRANPNQVPVFDCHSHGHLPAFFSREDDADDGSNDDLKVSIVLGNTHQSRLSLVARITAHQINLDISDWLIALCHDGFCTPPLHAKRDHD